jgi:hypothetical protein
MDQRIAVHLARRGEQKTRALPLGEAERVVRPVGAHLEGLQWKSQIVDRARRACKVIDDVDLFVDLEVAGDVVVDEDEAVTAEVLDVLQRARLQAVDADNAASFVHEVVAKVRAEEACAPCDHRGRHRIDATQGFGRPPLPSQNTYDARTERPHFAQIASLFARRPR